MLLQPKHIPEGLLTVKSTELHKIFPTPAHMYFEGKKKQPLFLSCLMHGNEFTGLLVLQELLKKYGEDKWPRSVHLFFGNVTAAKEGRRHLDNQIDFNRIWKVGDLPENKVAMAVWEELKKTGVFACVDIHNNTGRNPHYSLITNQKPKSLNLAALFGPLCMYFDERIGTCTETMADFGPACTLEAGLPGKPDGTTHVLEFIEKLMALDEIPELPATELKLTLMDTLGTIKIDPKNSVAVGHTAGDIQFENDFDLMNFTEVPQGKVFGRYNDGHRLILKDTHGHDLSARFFDYKDGEIRIKEAMIPAMITLDEKILKSDCVCYLMRKLQLAS